MVGCSIRNCKSRSLKGGTIRFFTFPRNESVANEWLRYCGPKTTTKNGRVCSNHFLSSDYYTPLQQILLNESLRNVRKLKSDALPTLLIDETDNQNTLRNRLPIEINSQNVDTSDNIPLFPECNTIPDTEVAGSSKNVEKSDENITIPLAEYKLYKRSLNEYDVLKKNLAKIFTPGQIRCFMKPNKRRVRWSAEDIAAAISLRSISPKCYRHLRATVGIPLPAFSTLRKWASKFETKEGLLENVVTLMKSKAKSFNALENLITLSFDEIYLSNKIEIDKECEQKVVPHKNCQCIMARGLCGNYSA